MITNERRLDLYRAIKASYEKEDINKLKKNMAKANYLYDPMLSNKDNKIFYNPVLNTVLFTVAGTDINNYKDIITDANIPFNNLENTNRYKDAERRYKLAKSKYLGRQFINVGHSLGGGIVKKLASDYDKVYTLNAAAQPNDKSRKNELNLQVKGDPYSIFLDKPTIIEKRKIHGPHDSANLKKTNIFI